MYNNGSVQIINSEKAVGTILSNFSTDFVMDVIEDNIKMKFRPYNVGSANFPVVIDQNLNLAKLENPAFTDQIEDARAKTHREIINKICDYYNLRFIGEEYQEYTSFQLSTLATTLYDIFVTNFTNRMVGFFVRFIYDNREDICKSLEAGNEDIAKKGKESMSYGKKIYTDPCMIQIHSNLNVVLHNMAGFDVPFSVLLRYISDINTANYLSSILVDTGDIYKNHYASYILNPMTRADMFTTVKLQLQELSDKQIDPSQFTKGGEN